MKEISQIRSNLHTCLKQVKFLQIHPLDSELIFTSHTQDQRNTAWTVDESEGYESAASMRFDVPNENDPAGNYAGASFIVDGSGRDLTEFDALTFWAKASRGVAIGAMGFGQDFGSEQIRSI